jgi:hypothetical protein
MGVLVVGLVAGFGDQPVFAGFADDDATQNAGQRIPDKNGHV